jgi:hypothetical protein
VSGWSARGHQLIQTTRAVSNTRGEESSDRSVVLGRAYPALQSVPSESVRGENESSFSLAALGNQTNAHATRSGYIDDLQFMMWMTHLVALLPVIRPPLRSTVGEAAQAVTDCLDVLVQSRRDRHAARRLMRKLIRKHGRAPRVLITDKLKSYAAANRDLGLKGEHRQHMGLNNRAENTHQPTRVREKVMRRFKSARHLQRFASVHDQVGNLFMHCRYRADAKEKWPPTRTHTFEACESVTGAPMLERLAA